MPLAETTALALHACVNSKQTATLAEVFRTPTAKTLKWERVESLLLAVGCEIVDGKGSHVTFLLGEDLLATVRPHPRKEAKAWQVRDARDFLARNGVKP